MKLSPRDAPGYFARPDPARTGLLIHGVDAMRIALRRAEVIAALAGPTGDEEMRVTRMSASELRKDPARLNDAVKAASFFPGARVAFVEDATEALAAPILAALEDWREGDAQIIVTAGKLTPASKLRKAFEAHKNAYAAAIYNDPPSRAEIDEMLKKSGLKTIGQDALRDLNDLARALDPGDFRQTVDKLALYKLDDESTLTPDDIATCAPLSVEAELDDILHIVAEARSGEIGPMMKRLRAQGVQPVALCIAATRYFRTLYTAASDPGGVAQGMSRMRPPVFGPRRDRMQRQAQAWGAANLEAALSLLTETDLALRSAAQTAPPMPLVERALIRLAMITRR